MSRLGASTPPPPGGTRPRDSACRCPWDGPDLGAQLLPDPVQGELVVVRDQVDRPRRDRTSATIL